MLHECRVTIPELNPEMDVFRVGTLLEMVREMALGLAQDGQRVKVSVQQAMGQGVFQVCGATPCSCQNILLDHPFQAPRSVHLACF